MLGVRPLMVRNSSRAIREALTGAEGVVMKLKVALRAGEGIEEMKLAAASRSTEGMRETKSRSGGRKRPGRSGEVRSYNGPEERTG
jgi:hypothetical protein